MTKRRTPPLMMLSSLISSAHTRVCQPFCPFSSCYLFPASHSSPSLSLAHPHHCEQGRKTENQFPSVAPINKLWRFSVLSKMRFATNLIYLNCSCPPRIKTPSEHISLGLVRSLMHWKYPDFSLMEKTCTESGELRL